MSSWGTSQSAAAQVAAEVNNLKARLSTAKSTLASNNEALNQLKTRHANQYNILIELRNEVDRNDCEAQLAYSSNQLREYRYKVEYMNNIGVQRGYLMREWAALGRQIQDANEELRVLDEEISRLEQYLDAAQN